MKRQATTDGPDGRKQYRWYVASKEIVSVTWAESREAAARKGKVSVKSVYPAPSASDERRPLKQNLASNIATETRP